MYLADIPAADAASCHPDLNRIGDDIAAFELSDDEKVDILAAVRVHEDPDETETAIIAAARRTADKVRAVTWEMIRDETARDSTMQELSELARKGFPDSVNKIPKNLSEYWRCREGLYEVNGVILYEGRIVIPLRLRNKVSTILHIAHQGTSQMGNRAVDTIFWPGYTADIMTTRKSCTHCEVNAPSQHSQHTVEPFIASAPFEAVATDYCDVKGHHYLILVDRFSNWPVVYSQPRDIQLRGEGSIVRLT